MAVYIVTDYKNLAFREYKIGRCTNTDRQPLLTRYHTSMPEVRIILFQPCDDPTAIETAVKRKFYGQMVKNGNGNNSEVFRGDISEVIAFIFSSLISESKALATKEKTIKSEDAALINNPSPKIPFENGTKSLEEIMTNLVERHSSQFKSSLPKPKIVNGAITMWIKTMDLWQSLDHKRSSIPHDKILEIFITHYIDYVNKLEISGEMSEDDLKVFEGEDIKDKPREQSESLNSPK